ISMEEINQISDAIKSGENPIQYKKKLAFEITKDLNNESDAKNAQDVFEGNAEEEIKEVNIEGTNLSEILIETNLLPSMSEIKRKFGENGIKVNGKTPENLKTEIESGSVISVGRNKVKVIKK
ncbi:MAG: hypothetical protein KBD76_14715, partial [Bacteriovorax sp.]|nr:hypothetical protein [Bacteriovorax sp.]